MLPRKKFLGAGPLSGFYERFVCQANMKHTSTQRICNSSIFYTQSDEFFDPDVPLTVIFTTTDLFSFHTTARR